MESNEDNDSSFELFEAMPMPSTVAETSMSIVAIPDDNASEHFKHFETSQMDISKVFQSGNNSGNDLETKLMQPSYDVIKAEQLSSEDMNNLDKQQKQERVKSLNTISNRSNSDSQSESTFSAELEQYLKQLRDENDNLKNALERNNAAMKQQLNSLKEWQCAMNAAKQEQIESNEQSRRVIDNLEEKNFKLSERVKELEGMAGLKLVDELGVEVASLRSQMDEKVKYQSINEGLHNENKELTNKLMEATQVIASMSHEITSLNNQLNEANARLDSMPIMKSQLNIYERDFKMEEISKLAALKEVDALEREIDNLKAAKRELEEKLERGQPAVDLKEETTVGNHERHRKSRHARKSHRNHIPVLNAGLVLRHFKQYKTTSNNA